MKSFAPFMLALLLMSGCDRSTGQQDPKPGGQAATPGVKVLCAPHGSESYEPDCSLAVSQTPQGQLYVVRGPDGGFRRLLRTGDARLFVAADGAEPASAKQRDERYIEVAIGDDHYLFDAAQGAVPAKGSN